MERYSGTIKTLFHIGRPLSPIYSAAMRLRSFLYTKGILKQHRLPVPVISVGNLTLGGTGKTPLVQYITKKLIQCNLKPAILSRGYGGRAHAQINIVSDGKNILLDAVYSGDEPRLLAEDLPSVPVLTGNKRAVTGQHAIKEMGANIIILDDGFQHLGVKRDVDLVLFNADSPLGLNRVLPGGDLREPLDALQRADGFIITGLHDENRHKVSSFQHNLEKRFPGIPFFLGEYTPVPHFKKATNHIITSIPISEVLGLPFYAFCGIANPESFKNLLACHNFKINGFSTFQDHHSYTKKNICTLHDRAQNSGAQALITTSKDFVKLKSMMPIDMPIFSLDIELVLDASFDGFLAQRIDSFNNDK